MKTSMRGVNIVTNSNKAEFFEAVGEFDDHAGLMKDILIPPHGKEILYGFTRMVIALDRDSIPTIRFYQNDVELCSLSPESPVYPGETLELNNLKGYIQFDLNIGNIFNSKDLREENRVLKKRLEDLETAQAALKLLLK